MGKLKTEFTTPIGKTTSLGYRTLLSLHAGPRFDCITVNIVVVQLLSFTSMSISTCKMNSMVCDIIKINITSFDFSHLFPNHWHSFGLCFQTSEVSKSLTALWYFSSVDSRATQDLLLFVRDIIFLLHCLPLPGLLTMEITKVNTATCPCTMCASVLYWLQNRYNDYV